MLDATTFAREIKPLASIKDNYEKLVLTLDKLTPGNYNGIKVINLLDWLLEQSYNTKQFYQHRIFKNASLPKTSTTSESAGKKMVCP